uniref:Xylulose kinase-1 n=1 Tax=Tanacetum cinerariifolium TaxID=118510 RepID=A0A6L2PAT4_TANCI|nr:hypothetical protein [Tanacetum cinerariifolium]
MSTPTFGKTYNLIAYLEKPTESKGFAQIIDFLNGSSVKYALTVSPTIHTSCIKQFWTSGKVKTVNDEVRIQALVDGKRINIKGSSIRCIPRLEDADGTSCLTSAEIFKGLARMGAKTTSWNEFSSTMTSAIICLATNQKFNFSRYILLSLVKNIEAVVPFFMFPRFVQLNINHQLGDMTHHKDIFSTPSLTKKVFANMKRVCTGFSGEVTILFDNMLVQALEDVGEIIQTGEENIDADVEINLEKAQAKAYNLDLDHQEKVLSMLDVNDGEPVDVEEVLAVVKAAKLITEVVTTARVDVNAASIQDTPISAAEATKVSVPRKRRGVIIQDPKETTTIVTLQLKVQEKDKRKGILIEEHKPLKRQAQIKLDEEVVRHLKAELNAVIKWKAVIEQSKGKKIGSELSSLKFAVVIQLLRIYMHDLFTDEIRPLFEKHYNYNQAFLNEVNEGVKVLEKEVSQEKEVEVESSKREDATPLALKIPIIDYKIHTERNRPYFKIIRADGDHIERFAKTKPKNYLDDFLLNTLKIMFKKPNVKANVWKDQKGKYGLAKVKRWKLFESCRVHCLTLSTTQIFLLVERMYTLTHFTLEQMVNDVRLEVEDESEMSLKILRLVRRQLN